MTIKELLAEPGVINKIHEKTGVSRSGLFGIKNGKTNPTIPMFCKICKAAGEDPTQTFDDTIKEAVNTIS